MKISTILLFLAILISGSAFAQTNYDFTFSYGGNEVSGVIVSQPAVEVPGGYLSITFTATSGTYVFRDAVVGSPASINGLTSDQLFTIELNRFENWYAIVNPSGYVVPEMNASLIPQVGLLLGCLFFLMGRKKEVVEPMLAV